MLSKTASCALLCLGACAAPKANQPGAQTSAPLTISIVATNDVHGQLGRLPYVAGFVDNLKKKRAFDGGVLLVDAGDAFQGTIESNVNEGAAVMSAYAAMGYAAFTIGNHEFDFGPVGPASMACDPGMDPQGALRARVESARFPVVSSNLKTSSGQTPPWKNLTPSTVVMVGDVRIGIVGLITEEAADVTKSVNFAGLHVTPLAEAAIREAEQLRREKVDLVLVLAHAGGECTQFEDPMDLSSCDLNQEVFRLARALPPGLVDVIVGGHRNAAVAHYVNGIPIVHAESNLLGFSRVDLVLDGTTHRVLGKKLFPPHPVCRTAPEEQCEPGSYEGEKVRPDPRTSAAVGPAIEAARVMRDRSLGVRVVQTFSVRKGQENALGNLFADLMREAVPGADGAFGNAGSVRDDLPPGDLTFGHIHHVMPFDNQLAKLHVTGAELRRLIAVNLRQKGHGPLSISGFGVNASCNGSDADVTLTHPDGAAIRDQEQLVIVTNDFLALGGDGLLPAIPLPPEKIEFDAGKTVLDVLISGLEKRHEISPADKTLYDPARPRMRLAGGFPLVCGSASSSPVPRVVPPRGP
jgi:5'-nucleotidase